MYNVYTFHRGYPGYPIATKIQKTCGESWKSLRRLAAAAAASSLLFSDWQGDYTEKLWALVNWGC